MKSRESGWKNFCKQKTWETCFEKYFSELFSASSKEGDTKNNNVELQNF